MTAKAQLNIKVDVKLHDKLQQEAAKRGITPSLYARQLFEAAWAARHVETGDRDLDATVLATLILNSGDLDTARIARALRCPAPVVERIVQAWHGQDWSSFLSEPVARNARAA